MKHEDRDIARVLLVRADQESAERFSVGCGNEEFLEVSDAELGWARDVGAGIRGKASWVDKFAVAVSGASGSPRRDSLLLEVQKSAEHSGDTGGGEDG
jgi:hypothetical protein